MYKLSRSRIFIILAICVLGLFFAAVTGISFGGGERIDLPIGPCVVAFNILALLVCILISKVRGRRKKSKVHAENAAA